MLCPRKVKDKFSRSMISRVQDTFLESSSHRKGAADKVYAPHYFLLSIPRRCFYGALTAPCHREMGWKRVGILCQLLFKSSPSAKQHSSALLSECLATQLVQPPGMIKVVG